MGHGEEEVLSDTIFLPKAGNFVKLLHAAASCEAAAPGETPPSSQRFKREENQPEGMLHDTVGIQGRG